MNVVHCSTNFFWRELLKIPLFYITIFTNLRISFQYHPDTSRTSELDPKKFTAIMEAYKVLGKKDSRAAYDNILNANIIGDPQDFNSYYGYQR